MTLLDYEERASEAVRDYLGSMIPNSEVKRLARNGEDSQLLLLTMPQFVAGFGFMSRDLKSTYGRLYEVFKREYAEHRNEWDELDLAFVLCVREGVAGLQAFGSSVETDVYFCRKYVVPMNGHVESSLARLPFLPLFTERGVAVRPPSAQTFLKESGVPPVLARYVVKKGERSARSILDECVGGSFGELLAPERSAGGGREAIAVEAAEIRVRSVNIEGFRAYRRKRELSFGEDLTILYGPNGFGKTSVFDAIDFAFTGEIGRLQTRSEARFRRVAAHLDNRNGGGGVALAVEIDGDTHQLVRRVTDRKKAELDGISLDRKATLERLTGWRGPGADRIENMISLFRATHLFSQEHQELAREFHPECRLSSEVVARLLAYEDYHATRAKVSDIYDIAKKEIRALDVEIEKTARQAEEESEELESLGRALQGESSNEDLSALIDDIAKRIVAVGIEIASREAKTETVRSWRAALETRSSNLQRQSKVLRACAGLLEELPRRREELARAEARLEKLKSKVTQAAKRTREARERLRERTAKVDRLGGRLKYLVGRRDTLAWVEENEGVHAGLRAEVASASERLARKASDLDGLGDREKFLSARLKERESRRAAATRALGKTQSKLQRAKTILEGIAGWQEKTKRLGSIGEEQERLKKTMLEVQRSAKRLRAERKAAVEDEYRLSETIGAIEAKRGELSDLVGTLEGHIEGGVCPTCGQDHGSRRRLLDRISAQLRQKVATDERVSRDAVRTRIEELHSSIEEVEGRGGLATRQFAELSEGKDMVVTEIDAFRGLIEEFTVLAGDDPDAARKEVAAQFGLLETQIGDWKAEAASAAEEWQTARREWEATARSIRQLQEEVNEFRNKQEGVSKRLERLLKNQRNQGDVGLGSSEETVREQKRLTEAEVTSTRKLLEREKEAIQRDEESLSVSKAVLASTEEESSTLVQEIAKLGDRRRKIESVLTDAEVKTDEDQEAVLDRARVVVEKASVVNGLIEDVAGVELVIDAATTRAAYRRLQSRLAERRTAMTELMSKRRANARWLEYFREVLELVASEQDTAVSRFTREYGPRTSVIQRRLRSVYGFDDVAIRNEGSKILVRVSRDGRLLRPTDYFSQSQQQTLLLGLFLAACVSQTWSGLAPVFLDDPIAHFDDLNIFAFLDLIDGLLNDYGAGKRQFVLSTCDEKFLELAREKFAYRGESVKYYSFQGIGEDGPIVRLS